MKIPYQHYWGILLSILIITSCEREVHERYQVPDELNSTIYKALKNNESYSLFTEAIDSAKLGRMCDGRAALTVFAPDNIAVTKWMLERSYNAISDIPKDELELMVKSHVVENIFEEQQINQLGKDVVYRLMTLAQKAISVDSSYTGSTYWVHHEKKMMPVFTPTMFTSEKLSDPEYNYKYVFNKEYNGRLMYSNAGVVEYSIPCTNGYLYHLDDVVTNTSNLEEVLKGKDDYSLMLALFSMAAYYEYDRAKSDLYSHIANHIYNKKYRDVPGISAEQKGVTLKDKMSSSSTIFAVRDDVLVNYLKETFINEEVRSIGDISLISLAFVLKYLSASDLIGWPEKIENQTFRNDFGSYINFDVNNDVDFVEYTSNGLMYGLKKMPPVSLFNSIMRLPFTNPNYSYFLYAAQYANVLNLLVNNRYDFSAFIPENSAWEDGGIKLDVGHPSMLGDETFQIFNHYLNRWDVATPAAIGRFVKNHIVKNITQVSDEWQLAETLNDYGLVFLSNDGIVGGGNQYAGEIVNFTDTEKQASNGRYNTVDNTVKLMPYTFGQVLRMNPEFKEFYNLIDKTGGWQESRGDVMGISWLPPDLYNLFVPSNEAILAAFDAGIIPIEPDSTLTKEQLNDPTTSKAVIYAPLVNWLRYYFVGLGSLVRTQYILPTELVDGGWDTPVVDKKNSTPDEEVYHKLHLKFSPNEQKVIGEDGREANIMLEGTAISSNALIYKINNVVSFR